MRVHAVEIAAAPSPPTEHARIGPQGADRPAPGNAASARTAPHDLKKPAGKPGPPAATSTPDQRSDASPSAPARVAPSMRLRYDITGMTRERPVAGRAELAWEHDGHRYQARLDQEGDGVTRRSQHSAGQVTPQGLAPERFSERTRHEEAVHFERESGRIVFSANRPAATLLPGAQDRLSVLMELGARIAANPRAYPRGTHLAIQAATARDAQIWRFRVESVEELRLPGGYQTAMHLVRLPAGDFEPALEVWLAPTLDYAPVRLRLTQHTGDWLDQQWSGTDRR